MSRASSVTEIRHSNAPHGWIKEGVGQCCHVQKLIESVPIHYFISLEFLDTITTIVYFVIVAVM